MLTDILCFTNQNIAKNNLKLKIKDKPIILDELIGFIGLLLLFGVTSQSNL